MTSKSIPDTIENELKSRMAQATKAAELLRSAAERIESAEPGEDRAEMAARLRGAAVLGHTASLELAAASGWVEALVTFELGGGG